MISQTTLRSLRTAKANELLVALGDPPGDLSTAKLIKALQRALDEGIRIGLDAALEIHKEQKLAGSKR